MNGRRSAGTARGNAMERPRRKELDVFYIPTRYPNGVPDGAPYEFFGPKHSERGAAAYRKIAEMIGPLFAHLGE